MKVTNQTNMSMHSTSNYFAVNTEKPFILGNIEISYQDLYVYLGSQVSNSAMKKQLANHAATKQCHIRKFSSFF